MNRLTSQLEGHTFLCHVPNEYSYNPDSPNSSEEVGDLSTERVTEQTVKWYIRSSRHGEPLAMEDGKGGDMESRLCRPFCLQTAELAVCISEKAECVACGLEAQVSASKPPRSRQWVICPNIRWKNIFFLQQVKPSLKRNAILVYKAIRGFEVRTYPSPNAIPTMVLKHPRKRAIKVYFFFFNTKAFNVIHCRKFSNQHWHAFAWAFYCKKERTPPCPHPWRTRNFSHNPDKLFFYSLESYTK